jgi:hypothetical protein
MMDDPTLDAHEHAQHAEHAVHEHDPFISRVSLSIAILAVLAAVAGSLETIEGGNAITSSSEAVMAQDKATDAWNEYQADSLKRHMYEIAAANPGAHADEYARDAAGQRKGQDAASDAAKEYEKERDRMTAESQKHETRHHWLTGGATLLEIGIALSTVAIITKRQPFWIAAMGLGALGVTLFALAYIIG